MGTRLSLQAKRTLAKALAIEPVTTTPASPVPTATTTARRGTAHSTAASSATSVTERTAETSWTAPERTKTAKAMNSTRTLLLLRDASAVR